MELTREHRRALMAKLEDAKMELNTSKACLEKHKDAEIAPFFEMDCFIQQQTIALITNSLIDNHIDF
jgi:hypothetical protein